MQDRPSELWQGERRHELVLENYVRRCHILDQIIGDKDPGVMKRNKLRMINAYYVSLSQEKIKMHWKMNIGVNK